MKVFQTQNEPHAEISAAAVLSRSLVEQGKGHEAAAGLKTPLKLAEKSSDLTTRLSLIIAQANALAAAGDLAAAERAARRELDEAPKDLFRLRLEASLSLAEIQAKEKKATQANRGFQEASRVAKEKGFELIAHRPSVSGRP